MFYTILCDLHLSEDTEETVFSILSYAAGLKGRLAILGDFYDTTYKDSQVNARLQNRVYRFFKEHFTKEILYIIPGNHDMYGSHFGESALSVFDGIATVHEEPTLDDEGVLWLPYKDGGYERSFIQRFRADVVFTHNDFRYSYMRKGLLSPEGMEPDIFEGTTVFNGHYHFANVHNHIVCVGSQYAVHKTETFDQKTLCKVHFKDKKYTRYTQSNVRFGRRDFVMDIDRCRELCETVWIPYLANGTSPPASYPTIQDTLTIEYDTDPDIGFLKEVVHSAIHLRKRCVTAITPSFVMLDGVLDNLTNVATHLYDEGVAAHTKAAYESFLKGYTPKRSTQPTRLVLETMRLDNFCGAKDRTVRFETGAHRVLGQNGAGKTITYPTALLYCLAGVVDGRFSDERMVLSDIGAGGVAVTGTVNDAPFVVERTYTGKKTTLAFQLNGKRIKLPTIKQVQQKLCQTLFDVAPVGCPNRFVHKLLLQRVVWKQGNQESNLLKLSKDARQLVFLESVERDVYYHFLKHLKTDNLKQKKKLERQRQRVQRLAIQLEERKELSEIETVGLGAWQAQRRMQLTLCKERIKRLTDNPVPKPTSFDDLDTYMEYTTSLCRLNSTIRFYLESNEGLRWSPEGNLSKWMETKRDIDDCQQGLKTTVENIKLTTQCTKAVQCIVDTYAKSVEAEILKRDAPMKYLSGGEYETVCLQVYLDFHAFIQHRWSCNLVIFDEPGTAMTTSTLQAFVDKLDRGKCSILISHKNIQCDTKKDLY